MTPERCPFASWRGPIPNVGGTLRGVRLIVVHAAQGTQAGTLAWFANPDAQVSAHFVISRSGAIDQVVALTEQAWAEEKYNDCAWSIEHEGFSSDAELPEGQLATFDAATRAMYDARGAGMTPAQLGASVKLIKWLGGIIDVERGLAYGTAAKRNSIPSGVGVISHGELGMAGGNHLECPGHVIIDQLNVVLRPEPAKLPAIREDVVIAKAEPQEKESNVNSTIKLPFSASQLRTFTAEAGALVVFINDFVKFANPGGSIKEWLTAAATGIAWISHTATKTAQAKATAAKVQAE